MKQILYIFNSFTNNLVNRYWMEQVNVDKSNITKMIELLNTTTCTAYSTFAYISMFISTHVFLIQETVYHTKTFFGTYKLFSNT